MKLPSFPQERRNAGLIKTIIIIIIAIAVISYLGFDLKKVFESDQSKDNFSYVWNAVKYVWNNFLAGPVVWIWQNIVIDIVWEMLLQPALEALKMAKKE